MLLVVLCVLLSSLVDVDVCTVFVDVAIDSNIYGNTTAIVLGIGVVAVTCVNVVVGGGGGRVCNIVVVVVVVVVVGCCCWCS